MKIAVFHNLPSGGAKRALHGFIKHLIESGNRVDVFIPSTADENFLPLKNLSNKIEIFPITKTLLGVIRSTIRYVSPWECSLIDLERTHENIAHTINKGEYDVVLVEQDQFTFSPFILKFLEKPTVYYCQQPSRFNEAIYQKLYLEMRNLQGEDYGLKYQLRQYALSKKVRIDYNNASFASYILANSYFSRENILRSYGLNSFVSYLGVDTMIFQDLRIAKENYVLSVGSCTPFKGHDFIVRALSLIEKNQRPKLLIATNDIYAAWQRHLEQIATQKDVELEITTQVSDDDLVRIYNKAKLFLYASYLEPFGLAPLEAMACGTPVIAVKEGGVRETVIHNEVGVLTDRIEAIFAEAIADLVADDKRRCYMGQQAVDLVQSFWTLKHAGERLIWHLNNAS